MMSTNFLDFLTPSPSRLHLELIKTIKFTQPPIFHLLFHDPSPSLKPPKTELATADGDTRNLGSMFCSDKFVTFHQQHPSSSAGNYSSLARRRHRLLAGTELVNKAFVIMPVTHRVYGKGTKESTRGTPHAMGKTNRDHGMECCEIIKREFFPGSHVSSAV